MKNVMILGDSFSTFEGHIPEGYLTYFSENGKYQSNVSKVEETWWYPIIKEKGLNLVLNDSWSGSTICFTGYDNCDCSKTSSFIYRFEKLRDEGFFEKNEIDTLFIFGGANDSGANSPLGEIKFDDFKREDLYFALPAIAYLFKIVKETLPKANIYCMLHTEIKPEVTNALIEASDKYGITKIAFKEIEKLDSHPTIKGMEQIRDTVLSVVE